MPTRLIRLKEAKPIHFRPKIRAKRSVIREQQPSEDKALRIPCGWAQVSAQNKQ